MVDKKIRCDWATGESEKKYHDDEWGSPSRDDHHLFEMLILEGMQAGLSWSTILKKREGMRKAFDNFRLDKIIKYDANKIEELMNNPEIIRNRLKINSVITNAKLYKEIQKEYGTFSKYLWGFTNNETINNSWEKMEDVPANTELSDKISSDLKKRGFKFVGSTIIYAYMQSVGIVDDHLNSCFKKS